MKFGFHSVSSFPCHHQRKFGFAVRLTGLYLIIGTLAEQQHAVNPLKRQISHCGQVLFYKILSLLRPPGNLIRRQVGALKAQNHFRIFTKLLIFQLFYDKIKTEMRCDE